MKGERRHELEKNELADWLADTGEKIKPYQNAILGTVLIVVLAVVLLTWWGRRTAASETAASDSFNRAMWLLPLSPGEALNFEGTAEDFPDSRSAPWALIVAADLHLANGCNEVFIDKALSSQELRDAIDLYEKVLADPDGTLLHERATFGLARAKETLCELDKATKHYEAVVRDWPEGTYAQAATNRLEDLKKHKTTQFYDRFAQHEPASTPSPEPLLPEDIPAFNFDSLPDEGPIFDSPLLDLEEGSDDTSATDAVPDITPEPLLPPDPSELSEPMLPAETTDASSPDEPAETVDP